MFQVLRIALKRLNRLSRKSACHYTFVARINFNPVHKTIINNNSPSTHTVYPDILNSQLFLSGCGFRPHVSGESGIRIRNFLNTLSRVEIFEEAMNPETFRC